jgi:hypothetical protein
VFPVDISFIPLTSLALCLQGSYLGSYLTLSELFFFLYWGNFLKKKFRKKNQVILECFKEFGEKRKKKKQEKIAKFLYSVFNV